MSAIQPVSRASDHSAFYTAFLRRVSGLAVGTVRDDRVGRGVFRTPADTDDDRASWARICACRSVSISVVRITNGKMAIYDTDHFATWLKDFADALEADEFDD
ncbi:hypothetical protein LMG28614_06926 [Paraburkholderia ultramafica]|uniref:Uncharacterized protein n=1 Tax=Paraburkholderia ultramafica TaxID=1544867 RepID=A0A6S7CGA9_9BURK|nr:hypothetical protein [Paraburkholderia ultramafica]CAB3808961.1 hypothetical protein LMG28614_06926 [Paraburkholderia ultramafica]